MIGLTGAVGVMVATKPVDFPNGAKGLAALVRDTSNSGILHLPRRRSRKVRLAAFDLPIRLPISKGRLYEVE
ncbi:hypothetical protein HUN39_15835 [Methylocystis sp. FS]|uniref:hypothetical protein n=1 Tax=Methylocystis silviterrae TaxID=2743612 RepID=UPI0015822263|nr:hypothetical protein [Methylocystis silviterrae]NUJ81467.1 hypothetical protein [Methylocystis silviterrae]